MKTKLEIINETVAYYTEDVDRRAVYPAGDCAYRGYEGRMCAVGRCLEVYYLDFEEITAQQLLEDYGDDILKPEYRGHEPDFWRALQLLHDSRFNWDKEGLTDIGKVSLKHIIEYWSS